MCSLTLEPPKNYHKCKICVFNMLGRILQHNVSKRPSVKLDHYSLSDGPSTIYIQVEIRLKTSCLIGREPFLFYCSLKHAIKSHVIVVMVTGY